MNITNLDSSHYSDSQLEKAKKYINEFCQSEYGVDADFNNLSKVNIAYTTDEDNELEIQVSVNLEQYCLIYEYDGNIVRKEQYSSLEEMNSNALSILNFEDLVDISDDEKAPFICT